MLAQVKTIQSNEFEDKTVQKQIVSLEDEDVAAVEDSALHRSVDFEDEGLVHFSKREAEPGRHGHGHGHGGYGHGHGHGGYGHGGHGHGGYGHGHRGKRSAEPGRHRGHGRKGHGGSKKSRFHGHGGGHKGKHFG